MALAREHAHEFVLRAVGVLVFVDEQVLEAAVVVFANRRGGFQQAHGFEQQVVEVEGVRFAEFFAVLLEKVSNLFVLGIG